MGNMIEVGEYVRTEKGKIGKVIKIRLPLKGLKNDRVAYLIEWADEKIYYISMIKDIKHSKNIIDLIEVGDYVNGELVVDIIEFWETLDDGTEEYRGRKLLTQYRIAQFKGTDMKYYIY